MKTVNDMQAKNLGSMSRLRFSWWRMHAYYGEYQNEIANPIHWKKLERRKNDVQWVFPRQKSKVQRKRLYD
jgi:hypothetical protein